MNAEREERYSNEGRNELDEEYEREGTKSDLDETLMYIPRISPHLLVSFKLEGEAWLLGRQKTQETSESVADLYRNEIFQPTSYIKETRYHVHFSEFQSSQ